MAVITVETSQNGPGVIAAETNIPAAHIATSIEHIN